MADYYPSEVARLVLGYLKEVSCAKTWETFLGESIDLQEHCRLLQSGRSCTTNIEGKSLLNILHEYRFLKDTAGRDTRNETNSNGANLNTPHLHPNSNNINPSSSNINPSSSTIHPSSSTIHPSSSNINPSSSTIHPSSSNINPSASCSENFKTPKKNNAEAFNRFKVHQATQSQATIRFAQVGNRTPRSIQTYLSTPTRQNSCRTPSRLQGVCVTTLNFGTGAERNEEPISVHRGGIFETPKSRTPTSLVSQRLCYSDTIKRRPVMISKLVQTETVNTPQVVIDNSNCHTSSNSPSHQTLSERASTESSHQLLNSVNSAHYSGENQILSIPESRNSLTNSEENLNDSRLMLPDNKTTANTAVVNQTIVFTSTEIRTSGDNESSVTPQYDIEPPTYARAPNTNSPRLILSFDRSQVASLTTPLKDRRHWTEEFASPKRKGTIPRRRLLSESPHPKQIPSNDSSFVSIHENVESIIEELMANQPFTQRLADNINKVICEEPEASNSNFPTLQDIQNSDIVIQNILARAESDSLFNDIISLFGNSRDCDDLNIQESAASEINFLTEGTQTNKDEREQAPVIEAITSKDETDNSKNHDNMQEKNDDQNSGNKTSLQIPSSSEVIPLSSESTANQNTPTDSNVGDPEPMQVDHDETNLTQESGPKDLLGSCMSIIQPDTETNMQDCNFDQNNDVPGNTNEVQSAPSDVNNSSTPVPASVTENITGLDDTSTLKPVSIGTPFQVGSQIAVSQATSNINQSIPTTQTIVCYPPPSLTNSTMSFIPSNRNIPILPAVQNQSFILNSNFQPSPVLQFSYTPAPGFPMQPLDGFQSKIFVVQQPCPTHSLNATNWAGNNLTNDVIIPVQTVSAETVAQPSVINPSPIKIPHDYSPSKSFLASNVGNFVTVTSETAQPKKNADKKQSSKFNIPASSAKNSLGRKKSKKPPKKKRRPLFPPPKDPDPDNPPENEISDNVPVLSIPDPSPNKDESMSAMEILTSITEGTNTQSPLLKAMISSAKILAEKGGRLNSTHVRALEFSAPETIQEEGNKSKHSRTSTEIDGRRSSPRLKQKTACKSPCCSPSKSIESANAKKKGSKHCTKEKVDMTADLVSNAIEKLTAHKAVSSSMSSVVLSAMQDALQTKPVKSKKQDSSSVCDVFQRAEISLTPIKKTPAKSSAIGKKAISREEYFPDSSSASDSESDNIPLSLFIASKSKDTLNIKETETSPLKQNNPQKPNVEKETIKNAVDEILLCTDVECINKSVIPKASELSESASVPLNAKSTEPSKTTVEKSSVLEDSNSPVKVSKTVCSNKENKSSKKATCSKKVKSKKLDDRCQQESSKVNEEKKKVSDNPPCDLIVLDSDEDMEVPEIENENIASHVICSSESKSSKKEQKRKHKKKKSTKLSSPSKEKTLDNKKSERKNSSVSRKSNSPRISETSDNILQSDKSDSQSEKSSCKVSQENFTEEKQNNKKSERRNSSVSRKSNSPRITETSDNILQSDKSGSQSERNTCKVSPKNFMEEKQNNKKSKTEDPNMPKKLSEKININETNLSNEETDALSQKHNYRVSPNFPTEKQKSWEKNKWYISSPQKEKEVCPSDSLEKSHNSSGTMKKSKKIDELCDKLRLNVVQNSPRKEGIINPSLKALHKLPPNVANITAKNSTDIPANETSFEQGLHPSKTTVLLSPVENETLKPTSIEILAPEKSITNADIRNTATLDSEITINSKQSSISDDPINPNFKKRALPPPKKRIRPVPVASPRDGRFSPFSPFSSPAHSVCFDSTLKPKEMPSISRNPSESQINKLIYCPSDLPSPAPLPCIDPPSGSIEISAIAKNTSNAEEINENISSAPELSSPINPLCSESTVKPKEMPSLSPINVRPARKYSTGKPKAMAEFYKSALPDRESDLPISPDPMSSSSCTIDTFLARRNIQPTDIFETVSNKENSLVDKIFPEKKEAEKVSQKRKLSSTSIKDSSDEEGLIKSPSRTETVVRSTSDTETASESAALVSSSQVQLKDVHLSSSDEEGLIKSPVKKLSCGQKSDQLPIQPEKKQKLSTGFSPPLENLNSLVSDQLKSFETDSFSLRDKTIEKQLQEEKSPGLHSILLNKSKPKSNLKKSAASPEIPAGVKIPDKWNNSKINNYSSIITRPENETGFKGPRRSRPNIKVVGFKSPPKPSSSFKRKNEHPSSLPSRPNPYRTLYSERQARKLQLENRRSSFRQSPNLNNCRSSTHPHRQENKHIMPPNFKYGENNLSFSKQSTTRNYSRKHEHRDISSKSSEIGYRNNESQKHLSPYESFSNRYASKHETSNSNFKVSEKDPGYQDSSNKHKQKERTMEIGYQNNESQKYLSPYESSSNRYASKPETSHSNFEVSEKDPGYQDSTNKHKQKERTILHEKSNPVSENHDKLSSKNIANVEVPEKPDKNTTSLKKSNENFHKQAPSSNFPVDKEKESSAHNNKNILAKEKLISTNNKRKSGNNLSDENKASLLSEKCHSVYKKSSVRLEVDQTQQNKLSYNKDTELGTLSKESHTELRQESQLENRSQILNTEQNKEVGDEHSDFNGSQIFDEAAGTSSRTSTDQNELDQAVAFLTNDGVPKSQEPVISSQNIAVGDKVADDTPDKDSEDFGALVIKQLSKAAGLSVPMQVKDISHLLAKIKELGLENIADIFGQKK